MRRFTIDELSEFDGQNGNPVYVAHRGKVYDLTGSDVWDDGNHMALHQAGADLTLEIESAPHDESLLVKFPVVGELAQELSQ